MSMLLYACCHRRLMGAASLCPACPGRQLSLETSWASGRFCVLLNCAPRTGFGCDLTRSGPTSSGFPSLRCVPSHGEPPRVLLQHHLATALHAACPASAGCRNWVLHLLRQRVQSVTGLQQAALP